MNADKFFEVADSLPDVKKPSAEGKRLSAVDISKRFPLDGTLASIITWDEEARMRFKDDQSAAEFSAALICARQGWSQDETYTLLQKAVIRALDDPKRTRKTYYETTIAKAFGVLEQEEDELAALAEGLGPIVDVDKPRGIGRVESPVVDVPPIPTGDMPPFEFKPLIEWIANRAVKSGKVFAMTDLGNAERFAAYLSEHARFVTKWKKWIVFDGRRWRIDDGVFVPMFSKAIARAIAAELLQIDDKKTAGALAMFARASESDSKLRAMINQAQSHWPIPISHDELDTDPWTFNVMNGTVDLHTGKLQKHNKADMISKLSSVMYDPDATCPKFMAFLEKVLPDPEVREHLQIWAGYSLTGMTGERKFRIDIGDRARNGKSTLYNILMALVGEYGAVAMFETFGLKSEGRVRNDLAALVGKRLIIAIESSQDFKMNVNMVKSLTGNDPITARFLFKEFFTYTPQFKVWLASNNPPKIQDDNNAIWDRMHRVDWEVRISEEEEIKGLSTIIIGKELSGILNWAIGGCIKWQHLGDINKPRAIQEATDRYREEEYVLFDFLEDMCEISPAFTETFDALYVAYANWCMLSDIQKIGPNKFGRALTQRFKKSKAHGDRVYIGLHVKTTL